MELYRLLRALTLTALFVSSAFAQEVPQYLFLIELSPQMARRQIATAQTVYDLVRSGFHERIQTGERFALWFYGARLQTNAPLVWDPARNIELAQRSTALFTGRVYSKLRPREETLADAAPFLASSPRLTVLILTDGFQPLAGAPFDTQINAALTRHRDQFARAEKPFLISLLAKDGKWIAANVHTNLNAPVEIAGVPNSELLNQARSALRASTDPEPARAALRNALNPPPSKTTVPEPAPSKPVEIAVAAPPEKPREDPQSQIIPETPAPTPEPASVIIKPAEVAKPVEEKPVVVVVEEPKAPKIIEEPIVPIEIQPNPVAAPQPPVVVAETITPESLKTSIPPVIPQTPTPLQTALLTPPTRQFPWPMLVAGLVMVAILGGLAFLRARQRAKSPGSLITQSLPGPETRPRQK